MLFAVSYPVILYPKLIAEFRRENPIPPNVRETANRTNQEFVNSSKSSKEWTATWFLYPLIVGGYALLLLAVGPLPAASFFQRLLIVAAGALCLATISLLLVQDYKRLEASVRGTNTNIVEVDTGTRGRGDAPREEDAATPSLTQETGRAKPLRIRLAKLATVLHNRVMQPTGVSNAPIGASEVAFGQVLESFFPGRVFSQLEFPIPDSEHSYSADFAIIFDEINLSIDCEIDEPYELKSNKPTHCTDRPLDRYRNQFFLEGNWIVVRFSEEQVVQYPKSCCKELAAVISAVTGLERYLLKFERVPDLPLKPQWTSKQARVMAKRRYRSRYLP